MLTTPNVLHDGPLDIATGGHRRETSWQNTQMAWSKLASKLLTTHRTPETLAEYRAMPRARQDETKDVGGFVGGYLVNGRRKAGNVLHRQVITLDIDFARQDTWECFTMLYDCAALVYSTHKHTVTAPRLRLVLPLDREVCPEEYIAIGRRIAGDLDIDLFDNTGFEPSRLMYWPSTSKDGVFFCELQDGAWLSADEVLSSYVNWQDSSEWPIGAQHEAAVTRSLKKQGNPLEKPGVLGTFCRLYDIHQVIEQFLDGAYEPCDIPSRYTFVNGSTSGGVVTYDDLFAYSHHDTDPTGGRLCNAFDLVRLHKFGLEDAQSAPNCPVNKLPSYQKMLEFATSLGAVKRLMGEERLAAAQTDFNFDVPACELDVALDGLETKKNPTVKLGSSRHDKKDKNEDTNTTDSINSNAAQDNNKDWLEQMDADKHGNYHSTTQNVTLVFENDPYFRGRFAFDSFEHREIILCNLPWRKYSKDTRYVVDTDEAHIRHYLEKAYGISSAPKVRDAFAVLMTNHTVNPVRAYLAECKKLYLSGDAGVGALERLFIDYLGAADTNYVRMVTRKMFVGAVARVMKPGVKFDHTLVLVGGQGVTKSSIIAKMGGGWYSDSLTSINTKEAYEQLQGIWLMEIAELSSLRKSEVETVKHFLSKSEDRYRAAYGYRSEKRPRTCAFFGTSNEIGFLKDPTGNRRFWPVQCDLDRATKRVFGDLDADKGAVIMRLWGEAMCLWEAGERIYLLKEESEMAAIAQQSHMEQDDRRGMVEAFLDMVLPLEWETMDMWERKAFIGAKEDSINVGLGVDGSSVGGGGTVTLFRDTVCVAEIWCEVLGGQQKDMTNYNTKSIHNLMHSLPGWKYKEIGKKRFPIYGIQRYYERVSSTSKLQKSKPVGARNSK